MTKELLNGLLAAVLRHQLRFLNSQATLTLKYTKLSPHTLDCKESVLFAVDKCEINNRLQAVDVGPLPFLKEK